MGKSKLNKQQYHGQRICKARQWLTTYTGTPKKIVKHYRERFQLDINTAIRDLQEIGVEFTQEYLDAVKQSERARIQQKHQKDSEKRQKEFNELYADSDDIFAFIAGYTAGGAPYGTTWEELGIEPYASSAEIETAYDNVGYGHIENQFEDFYEEEDYLAITDRLLMRCMEENDFDDYLKVLKDIMPKAMQKGEMKNYFIQGARESYKDMFQPHQLSVGIWTRDNFEFCGYCMLKHIDTSTPEIGIDLRKKYRRKHIGLESLTELLIFAKENYEVDHFIYEVDIENVASQKLAEHLGGERKEIKNTLPENIIKQMNEVMEQDNTDSFKHYEYWIF